MDSSGLVSCYNKGCGQKFNPNENVDDDNCCFHPGAPIFHDAYKGWSCCNKKSTDFTEFLNFKGCVQGKHSNDKPAEPEKKKAGDELEIPEPVAEQKPVIVALKRPAFESECTTLEPVVNNAFKQQMDQLDLSKKMKVVSIDGSIPIGTICKHGGCNCSYDSPASDYSTCVYHPGFPIFHEGLKFWSCCQRKTSDFTAFMEQKGCESGKHKWIQDEASKINCRWDWHQTASDVVIAVYAKSYDYKKSFVKVNPIRLTVKLIFPLEDNAEFNIDLELRGIIDVSRASVKMFGTKMEITLPKAEGGKWLKLDFPRAQEEQPENVQMINNGTGKIPEIDNHEETEADSESDIDLDDIEPMRGASLAELADYKLVEES